METTEEVTLTASVGFIHIDATAEPEEIEEGASYGSSWANAFPGNGDSMNLQAAIDAASAYATSNNNLQKVELWVGAGTYKPTAYIDPEDESDSRAKSFKLGDKVAIFGGFKGDEVDKGGRKEATETDNKIFEHETILSGDLNGDDSGRSGEAQCIAADDSNTEQLCGSGKEYLQSLTLEFGNNTGENAYHVIYNAPQAEGTTIAAELHGVVVEGGNANYATETHGDTRQYGGGIWNGAGTKLELAEATIRYNQADSSGGGIYNTNGDDFTLTSSLLQYNQAWGQGGGIYNSGTNFTLSSSLLFGNSAGNGPQLRADSPIKSYYSAIAGVTEGDTDATDGITHKGVVDYPEGAIPEFTESVTLTITGKEFTVEKVKSAASGWLQDKGVHVGRAEDGEGVVGFYYLQPDSSDATDPTNWIALADESNPESAPEAEEILTIGSGSTLDGVERSLDNRPDLGPFEYSGIEE